MKYTDREFGDVSLSKYIVLDYDVFDGWGVWGESDEFEEALRLYLEYLRMWSPNPVYICEVLAHPMSGLTLEQLREKAKGGDA